MTKRQKKDDAIALRKQLIQMRLELNRQKIRHEGLVLLEPVEKFRSYKKRFTEGSKPLLIVAGVTLASFFMARNRRSASSLMPIARIAASVLPLFIAASHSEKATTTGQADNLNKTH